jgi:hypothetical protein
MIAQVLSVQNHGLLSVVQVGTARQNTIEYISSATAIKGRHIEVREVSEAGMVNSILVVNNSGHFVFMLDGDILIGAKQNRVLNTSMFLPPNSKTEVPVSCVEQGRWRRVSPTFSGPNYTAPASLRAHKASMVSRNLAERRGHLSDQGEVWERVNSYQEASGVSSPTSSLSDVYEKNEQEFRDALAGFACDPHANGMALFCGKRMLSLELFNRTEVFGEYFPKLLRGAAMEYFGSGKDDQELPGPEASFRTLDMLDKIAEAKGEQFPGVAAGVEKRFDANGMSGFELDYEQHLIHAAAFASEQADRGSAA